MAIRIPQAVSPLHCADEARCALRGAAVGERVLEACLVLAFIGETCPVTFPLVELLPKEVQQDKD